MQSSNSSSISDKGFNKGYSLDENLEAFARNGFTHIHFSHRWKRRSILEADEIQRWEQALADAGVGVLDTHGPSPAIWHEDPEKRTYADRCFRDRLKLTARLGGDAMVYHVPKDRPRAVKLFIEGLARMEEEARELDVVVALENHYDDKMDREALVAAFKRFDPDYIGFTLDTGHGVRSGNLDWLLANCCHRLSILHLNDNTADSDRHWLPYDDEGVVPWDDVARAIAGSPYTKPLQLEVRWHPERDPGHEDYLALARERLTAIEESVAQYRQDP